MALRRFALTALATLLAALALPARSDEKARAYFTDTVLVDQDGRSVRFYSDVLDGNVVLLSFVFTRCTDACPLITRKMNATRRALGDRYGRDVRFVSISVDPEFDTPQELRRFIEKQQAGFTGWSWLTGKKADVDRVLAKLGEAVTDPGDHSTGFLAGNVRTGHWTKIRPDATPAVVAEQLQRLADEAAKNESETAPQPQAVR